MDRAHLLRNGSCVGSDISWSVSIPIQELTVVYRQAEHRKRHRFCFMAIYFYKMAQVKNMHDKPACTCSHLAYS